LFGHGVVWVGLENKSIVKERGLHCELGALQDCVIPLLEVLVVLKPCVPCKLGRAWGSLPLCSGAGCPLRWLLRKEVHILPETPGWKTSKADGIAQSQQPHRLLLE